MKRLAAAVAVAAALLWLSYLRGWWHLHEPSAQAYPVRGIDVSHHQGRIDWPSVAADGLRFAYIKASEGTDLRDHRFGQNWEGAGRAGLKRGAYHYFSFCKPGSEQARNFILALSSGPGELPPAVDFEFVGNCKARPPQEELARELRAFLAELQSWSGRTPLIYVTREAYDRYLRGQVDAYPLWVRGILFKPRLPDGRDWLFWQFSARSRVGGIKGFVDMSVFRGSEEEFRRLFP